MLTPRTSATFTVASRMTASVAQSMSADGLRAARAGGAGGGTGARDRQAELTDSPMRQAGEGLHLGRHRVEHVGGPREDGRVAEAPPQLQEVPPGRLGQRVGPHRPPHPLRAPLEVDDNTVVFTVAAER